MRSRCFHLLLAWGITIFVSVTITNRTYAADTGVPYLSEARAAAVCDQSGMMLWSSNAEEQLDPASITKVMTAMVALDSGKALSDTCFIYDTDLGWDSQTVGYVAGDAPSFRELLLAMLVFSGNDAATNVALNVCDTLDEFVGRMNDKASALGMTHTHFNNVHGLEQEGHYSCAADLVTMGRHAMMHYPFIAKAVSSRLVDVVAGGINMTLYSTDELIGMYPGMLGIKTGYVSTGASFLGACRRNGITLFTCVMCCETLDGRFEDTMSLLDWAFGAYRQKTFARGGWVLRVCGFADNFALKCLVKVPVGGVSGLVWPSGEGVSYRNVMCAQNVLVLPGQAYGCAWWRQAGRFVAGATWEVDRGLYVVPASSGLSTPLLGTWPPAPTFITTSKG